MTATDKFLKFNGKVIYFLAKDGQYWISIKPICEALNINFDRQYKNLKSHAAFGQLYAKQPMTGADGKVYKMIALPERYIYGWLFNIRSESPELVKYQLECCDLLFSHFHGKITSRETVISQKTKALLEYDNAMALVRSTPEGKRMFELEQSIRICNNALKALDNEIAKNQIPLFS